MPLATDNAATTCEELAGARAKISGVSAPAGRHTALTTVAWVAHGDIRYEDWVTQGARLGAAGRSCGWWLGDWLRYGAVRYGQKYAAAARVTGYDSQTLMNMAYVATRFDISRRRENLSWSHHAEVAALEPEEQERWLDKAGAERLSVRRLRQKILASREANPEHPPSQAVVGGAQPPRASSPSDEARQPLLQQNVASDAIDMTVVHTAICPRCGQHFLTS